MEDILKLLRERDERLEKLITKQLRAQARELKLYVRAYLRSYLRKLHQNDSISNDSASLAPAASSEQEVKKEPIIKRRHPRRTKLGLRSPSRPQDPAANKWLREWEVRLAELAHCRVNSRGSESMYPANHLNDHNDDYYHASSKTKNTRSSSPQKKLMAKPPANPTMRNGSPELRRSNSPSIIESHFKANDAPPSPAVSRSGSPKLIESTISGSPKSLEHHFESTALASRSSTPASVAISPTLKPNDHMEAGSRSTSPKVQYSNNKPPRRSTSPKFSNSVPNPARSYSTVPRSHPPSPSSKSVNMAVHTQQVGSTIFVAATRPTPPTPPLRTKIGQNSITLSPSPESAAIRIVKTTIKNNLQPSIVRSFSPSNANISPRIKDERMTSNLGQKMSMLCSSNRWGQMMPLVEPIDVDDASGGVFIRESKEIMDPS